MKKGIALIALWSIAVAALYQYSSYSLFLCVFFASLLVTIIWMVITPRQKKKRKPIAITAKKRKR